MNRVILILFSFAGLDEGVIEATFQLLDQSSELKVVAFVEEELPDSLSDLISNIGFLGERITNDLQETILAEYETRANRNLELIAKRAETEDCSVDLKLLTKARLPAVKEELKSGDLDHVVVNYTDDRFIAEEVLAYPLDQLLAEIDLSYEVYYDGRLSREDSAD